ncbi:unnamed protein product [Cylindrotheca closterium]|uniref:Uncharacterized protein n=1 Tax=Cylindrotheca closterium TaxID=2856 RepID=A0AAD2FVT8_9STRA|nr:unnamed protein product [Cylindrotheca closterium]
MDYFGKDTAWYGGWCRGRRSINCQVRIEDGFCDCVIAELPQACMTGCRRKIHEGDCITKNGAGWGHVECECDNSSHNHRKRRSQRRGQHEEEKEGQEPQLNQDNSLEGILEAISKYRSPSQRSAPTANSRRPQVRVHVNGKNTEEIDGHTGRKLRLRTVKAEIIDRSRLNSKVSKIQEGRPHSEVNSSVPSLPIVTPQSGKKRPRDESTVKPSRPSRRLQFEG